MCQWNLGLGVAYSILELAFRPSGCKASNSFETRRNLMRSHDNWRKYQRYSKNILRSIKKSKSTSIWFNLHQKTCRRNVQGGLQYLLAGARANVGVKSGHHLSTIESPPLCGEGAGHKDCDFHRVVICTLWYSVVVILLSLLLLLWWATSIVGIVLISYDWIKMIG
jgi:hypothetical protein